MSPNGSPIFLIGAERSGTTAVRLMLDHHPRIGWLNEFEYAVDRMRDQHHWPDLEQYYEWLSTHRIFEATGFAIDQSLDYPNLVRSFLDQRSTRTGKEHVGATVHQHFDRLPRIWSNARYLHIVRDPRDVARSAIPMGWAGNVYYGVDRWTAAQRTWEQMRGTLDENQYHEFRFEELIQHPKTELTKICEFIGVPYDAAMLTYDQDTTYSLPDPSLTYQWKRKLSAREIELVECKVLTRLAECGYEQCTTSPAPPSVIRKVYLALQNRSYKVRFRMRKYGLRLWLALLIVKRLGSTQLYNQYKLKKNAIDVAHLK